MVSKKLALHIVALSIPESHLQNYEKKKEQKKLLKGQATTGFLLYSLQQLIPEYDIKNLSHYLKKIHEFHESRKLKTDEETFLKIIDIMQRHNLTKRFQQTLYFQNSFKPHYSIRNLKGEAEQFVEYKMNSLSEDTQSILLKKHLMKGLPPEFRTIAKEKNISDYQLLLILEHACYVTECLEGIQKIDKEYLNVCLLSSVKHPDQIIPLKAS